MMLVVDSETSYGHKCCCMGCILCAIVWSSWYSRTAATSAAATTTAAATSCWCLWDASEFCSCSTATA